MQDENIAVSDLGLASLLATLEFELVGLKRADAKRINFMFAPADGIEKVISDYWAGIKVCIPVQSLFFNQKTLKNRLYAFK
jgi:hypothetical protein